MTSKPRVHGTRPRASDRDLGELIDPVDRSEVVRQVDEAGLRLVRFLWCGNDGTVRAKASARQGTAGAHAKRDRLDRRHERDERP